MKKVQRISYLEILEIILLDQLPLFWASQRPFVELLWQAEKHFDVEREEREVHERTRTTRSQGHHEPRGHPEQQRSQELLKIHDKVNPQITISKG